MTQAAWDYLVVTASNELQAVAYRSQLELRTKLGFIPRVKNVLVIPDPEGKRVGSGGSTIHCLIEIINREVGYGKGKSDAGSSGEGGRGGSFWRARIGGGAIPGIDAERGTAPPLIDEPAAWLEALKRLRILIVHAGGDSRRIPAYGACGKIFIPVPGESDRIPGMTLLDRLLPTYLSLPASPPERGQVVVTNGDVLLLFDHREVRFAEEGITALGCYVPPDLASEHGVICPEAEGVRVRLFLQKPSPAEQEKKRALNTSGQAVLDIGVMSFDALTAVQLMELCEIGRTAPGRLGWKGALSEAVEERGLDFYREICCALGTEATFDDYVRSVKASGSKLDVSHLRQIFEHLAGVPFSVSILPRCGFLHFGTPRELLESGAELLRAEAGLPERLPILSTNNEISGDGRILGTNAWVEGCRILAPLTLEGDNLVTGVDISCPLSLPKKSALDVIKGKDRLGKDVWFVRCYGVDDVFHKPMAHQKDSMADEARLVGMPLRNWLGIIGASEEDLWDKNVPHENRLIWNARIFPAAASPEGYREWLWMLEPEKAAPEVKAKWKAADRYSFAEMLRLASQEDFHRRRLENRAEEMRRSLRRLFRRESGFSASELALILESLDQRKTREWVAGILRLSAAHLCNEFGVKELSPDLEKLELARILHTLGSAILTAMAAGETSRDRLPEEGAASFSSPTRSPGDDASQADETLLPGRRGSKARLSSPAEALCPGDKNQGMTIGVLSNAYRSLSRPEQEALTAISLSAESARDARAWALAARKKAFEHIGRTIVLSREKLPGHPKNSLRADEIIWGRAPARLDLGGGWSDTPPYSLEHGGCVINAAVNLNGQPPIHAYARVIEEPVIRITSIDHGARIVIRELDGLLDYRSPESEFGLAKATLALSGFSPEHAEWPPDAKSLADMLRLFGGGIDLTTLAAIPSGSGLGTSSIMGAVLMAVVHRMIGKALSPRQLFHNVLRLEQELTTGGGWQDQVGGACGGVKIITTEPGLVPDPHISSVPDDVLNPRANGGQTLLYYTGLRRLAKNILQHVVGNYLDRDRSAMETLRRIHAFPPLMVEAMAGKDLRRFGELIDVAWNLNKAIDPDSTTPEIEAILERIRPRIYGAKLLGAGGGGFLLIVARSPAEAAAIRTDLESRPPNDRARFFDFDISPDGLSVTVS